MRGTSCKFAPAAAACDLGLAAAVKKLSSRSESDQLLLNKGFFPSKIGKLLFKMSDWWSCSFVFSKNAERLTDVCPIYCFNLIDLLFFLLLSEVMSEICTATKSCSAFLV